MRVPKTQRRPRAVARRGGRLGAAVLAVTLTLPLGAPAASPEVTPAAVGPAETAAASTPDIYEARAEVGGFTDSVSVPALFETFTPYSLSEAQNNASHGLHAVFYPGFLLSAAAFQQGFPPPPGTTETLYPQGPQDAQADVLPLPPSGGAGRFAGSSSHSEATGSHGEAHYGGFAPSPDFAVESSQAHTSTTAGSAVRSLADVTLKQVRIGPLVVDSVIATGEAVADGTPGGAHSEGSVVFAGATLAGTPVTLSPSGLTVADTAVELPGATPLDGLLAQTGISVRRLPDNRSTAEDGTESRLDIGGIEVRFDQPDREFAVTFVLGRLSVLARAVRTTPAVDGVSAEAPPVVPVDTVEPPPTAPAPTPPPAVLDVVADGSPTTRIVRRIVRVPATGGQDGAAHPAMVAAPAGVAAAPAATRPPVTHADWSGLAALLALAGPAALVIRRILRTAAAP